MSLAAGPDLQHCAFPPYRRRYEQRRVRIKLKIFWASHVDTGDPCHPLSACTGGLKQRRPPTSPDATPGDGFSSNWYPVLPSHSFAWSCELQGLVKFFNVERGFGFVHTILVVPPIQAAPKIGGTVSWSSFW
jgi:hypothetical protein